MRSHKKSKKKEIVAAVSGGFDPLHAGHVRMFDEARRLGDRLVVILNNDNWLRKKKGYIFMSEKERKEIIEGLKAVDFVMITSHPKNPKNPKDMSVSRELMRLRPDIFANGGDRNEADAANPKSSLYSDIHTCKKIGCKMVYNVGHGGKVQSSSWLLAKYMEMRKK